MDLQLELLPYHYYNTLGFDAHEECSLGANGNSIEVLLVIRFKCVLSY